MIHTKKTPKYQKKQTQNFSGFNFHLNLMNYNRMTRALKLGETAVLGMQLVIFLTVFGNLLCEF